MNRLTIVVLSMVAAWVYTRPKVVIQRVAVAPDTVQVLVPGPTTGQCLLETVPWMALHLRDDDPLTHTLNHGRDTVYFRDVYVPITKEAQRRLDDIWEAHIHEREVKYGYDKGPG